MVAWQAVQRGEPNPLPELLAEDEGITSYLSPEEVLSILREGAGVGDAPERSRRLAREIRQALAR